MILTFCNALTKKLKITTFLQSKNKDIVVLIKTYFLGESDIHHIVVLHGFLLKLLSITGK